MRPITIAHLTAPPPPPIAPWFKIRLKGKTPCDSADSFGVVDTRCVPSPFVWNAEFLSAQNRQSAWETRRGRPGASSAQREAAFRVRHVRGARGGRARCAGAFLLLTPPVEASPQRLKPASSYPGLETLLHLLLHADVVGGGGGGRMLDPPPPGSGPGTAWGPEACGRFSAPSDKGGARGRVLGPRRLNAGGPSPLP